jgi:hypothetical protein
VLVASAVHEQNGHTATRLWYQMVGIYEAGQYGPVAKRAGNIALRGHNIRHAASVLQPLYAPISH